VNRQIEDTDGNHLADEMIRQKEDIETIHARRDKGFGLPYRIEKEDGHVICGDIQEVVPAGDHPKGGRVTGDLGTGGRAKGGRVIEDRVIEDREIGDTQVTLGEGGVDRHAEIEHRRREDLETGGRDGKDREWTPLEVEGVHVHCLGAHVLDRFPQDVHVPDPGTSSQRQFQFNSLNRNKQTISASLVQLSWIMRR